MGRSETPARAAAIVTAGTYVEAIVGVAVGVLVARTLGSEGYGHYAFVVWLCGWLMLASNNAIPTTVIRFIAEARGSGNDALARHFARKAQKLAHLCNALVTVAFLAALPIWKPVHLTEGLISGAMLIAIGTCTRADFWTKAAIAKGFERYTAQYVALSVSALCNLLLVAIVSISAAWVYDFLIVYAASGLIAAVLIRTMLYDLFDAAYASNSYPNEDLRFNRHLRVAALVLIVGLIGNRSVEMLLLAHFSTVETVGFFAIAAGLTKGAVDLLAGGLSVILLPTMSRTLVSGEGTVLPRLVGESVRVFTVVGLAIASIGFVVARGAVSALYGSTFSDAGTVLAVSLVASGLMLSSSVASALLISLDAQVHRFRISVATVVVNVVLGLWLIPKYGLLGAAATSVGAQITAFVLYWVAATHLLSLKDVKMRLPVSLIARSILAACISVGIGTMVFWFLFDSASFLLSGLSVAFLYLGCLLVLRALRASDFDSLATVLGSNLRVGRKVAVSLSWLRDRFASEAS